MRDAQSQTVCITGGAGFIGSHLAEAFVEQHCGQPGLVVAVGAGLIARSSVLREDASLATFYVMAVALPRANQSYRTIMFSLVVNKARTAIKPRVFTDDLLPGGQLLMYVTDIPAATGVWQDVFIHDVQKPREPAVILARSGRLVIDERARSVALYLEQGARYSFDRADPTRDKRLDFKSHFVYLPEDAVFPQVTLTKGDREMDLADLRAKIAELRARGEPAKEGWRYEVEVHKKFAIPLACVVFGLLGLGLSLGSRKEARSAEFALSIAVTVPTPSCSV